MIKEFHTSLLSSDLDVVKDTIYDVICLITPKHRCILIAMYDLC